MPANWQLQVNGPLYLYSADMGLCANAKYSKAKPLTLNTLSKIAKTKINIHSLILTRS